MVSHVACSPCFWLTPALLFSVPLSYFLYFMENWCHKLNCLYAVIIRSQQNMLIRGSKWEGKLERWGTCQLQQDWVCPVHGKNDQHGTSEVVLINLSDIIKPVKGLSWQLDQIFLGLYLSFCWFVCFDGIWVVGDATPRWAATRWSRCYW